MAAFYLSSTNQRDDMTNLYLRDSGQTLYPESSVGGNTMFFNFASSGPYAELLDSNNESQSNCNKLPVISQESSMCGRAYNEMLFMQPNNGSMDGDNELVRNFVILNGQTLSLQQSSFSNVLGQGLSLGFGTQIPMSSFRLIEDANNIYHQMQIIVSSFDAIAGPGAAKPYAALALQTISRHFRSLRDAISSQIQSTQKILGEQDSSSTKGCGIPRLRYIDRHLRQQRAMQQFGMMQPYAWRPRRGLPNTSVSVLRAWLIEHLLHPY